MGCVWMNKGFSMGFVAQGVLKGSWFVFGRQVLRCRILGFGALVGML